MRAVSRLVLVISLVVGLMFLASYLSTGTITGLVTGDYDKLFSAVEETEYTNLESSYENTSDLSNKIETEPEEVVPEEVIETPKLQTSAELQSVWTHEEILEHFIPERYYKYYKHYFIDMATPTGETILPEMLPEKEIPQFGTKATVNTAVCFTASGISAPGDTINVTGNLSANIATCAIMDVPNQILECNGFTISGGGAASNDGVQIQATNVTVQNCVIENLNNQDGIEVTNLGGDFKILNNKIRNNPGSGIEAYNLNKGLIEGNNITNNSDHNVYLYALASDIQIRGNRISYAQGFKGNIRLGGFGLAAGNNITIEDNYFEDNQRRHIWGQTNVNVYDLSIRNNLFNTTNASIFYGTAISTSKFHRMTFENNEHRGEGRPSFRFQNGNDTIIRDNIVNGILIVEDDTGFPLDTYNTLFENNTFLTDFDNATNSYNAIYVRGIDNLTVRNHENLTMGVFITVCENVTVENNTLYGNAEVVLESDQSIQNWTVEDNTWPTVARFGGGSGGITVGLEVAGFEGVVMFGSGSLRNNKISNGVMYSIDVMANNSIIENNIISNVTGQGIILRYGKNNTIRNNTIYNLSGLAVKTENANTNYVYDNQIDFVIRNADTILNTYIPAPQIPLSTGVLIKNSSAVNFSNNRITAVNPNGLNNGILGVFVDGAANQIIENNNLTLMNQGVRVFNATNVKVQNNKLVDTRNKGIIFSYVIFSRIEDNNISTLLADQSPYEHKEGVELYNTIESFVLDNVIKGYHSGIYIQNSSGNNISNNNITNSQGYGVFSLQSTKNNIDSINTDATVENGIKLLYTTNTNITNSNFTSNNESIALYYSNNNLINGNSISATTGLLVDLFSTGNTVNTNTFFGNTIDILYDMYAAGNIGVGNIGIITVVSENGAAGNNII